MAQESGASIRFIGGHLDGNNYFLEENCGRFPFQGITCGSLSSKHPLNLIKTAASIYSGFRQSCRLLKEWQPHAVVGFGSYHTLPVLIAAKWLKIPIILHEANSIPGRVNRFIAPYALATGVHFPLSAKFIAGKTVHVGMPLRKGFRKGSISRGEACAYFNVDPQKPVLLIFGGSQGAQALNSLAVEIVQKKYLRNDLQLIHITGTKEGATLAKKCYDTLGVVSCVKDFECRINLAWQAADLLIARSGAGTIAEQIEFEVPGILIPYPFAADRHQDYNADFMAETVRGAIKLQEKEASSGQLQLSVASFFANGMENLHTMRNAIQCYKKETTTVDFCTFILEHSGDMMDKTWRSGATY